VFLLSRVNQDSSLSFVSHKFFNINGMVYLVCLCKDFKIKIWSIKVIFKTYISIVYNSKNVSCSQDNQCISVEDLAKYIKVENIIWGLLALET
jgi:hypothetical protein